MFFIEWFQISTLIVQNKSTGVRKTDYPAAIASYPVDDVVLFRCVGPVVIVVRADEPERVFHLQL